ncbi:MAG: undecaprenyldiphospho-muramoylpentapeptide beta-N-acetylglucosaminyltransferase [Planctomycetales bacterium]|nr:undecaprenyldiphospho-muramoylpentapeptide beta-N-acetylglucosaminyltransferase [Planctomycetales bacterium]
MTQPTCFVFAGGGTGGHLMPGLAVAAELLRNEPNARMIFVGSSRALERQIFSQPEGQRFEHVILAAEPLATVRRNPWRFIWRNWRAYREARHLLRDVRPTVVIGLGGYASFPVILAAQRLGIPTLLLEQNVIPGKATRWLSHRASAVCTSFEATSSHLPRGVRVVVTGNPVRAEIVDLRNITTPPQGKVQVDRDERPPTLLVLGGSQGASAINWAMIAAVEQLRSRLSGWRIVHQAGATDADAVGQRYTTMQVDHLVAPFFADMAAQYRQASLIVSRAGATTLAELACAGCPAILIPYPLAADNHQQLNADKFVAAGAARIVVQAIEPGDTANRLQREIEFVLDDPARLIAMRSAMFGLARPDAAQRVVVEIESLRHR